MKYESNRPIYLQVMDSLKKRMVAGALCAGDRLPSTRLLAVEYDINPNTAARVYKELEAEGICYTKRGEGTFVSDDPGTIPRIRDVEARNLVTSFVQAMTDLGYDKEAMARKILEEGDIPT